MELDEARAVLVARLVPRELLHPHRVDVLRLTHDVGLGAGQELAPSFAQASAEPEQPALGRRAALLRARCAAKLGQPVLVLGEALALAVRIHAAVRAEKVVLERRQERAARRVEVVGWHEEEERQHNAHGTGPGSEQALVPRSQITQKQLLLL